MSRRIRLTAVLLLLILSLAGCGKSESGQEDAYTGSNIAEIKKDGVISNTIEETFDSQYYDQDSLKEFVLKQAAQYNKEADGEPVSVKKLEVKKEQAVLTMEYRTAEDFSAFNGYPFFYGTVAEAYDAGYDLDVELSAAKEETGENDTIRKEQLLEMGSRKLVIVQVPEGESLAIRTSGKILYMSGAELVKKNMAVVENGDGSAYAYLVFK